LESLWAHNEPNPGTPGPLSQFSWAPFPRCLTNCRQAGVRFVRVTSNVDFSSLVRLPAYGPVVLRVGFYIELPQTPVGITNGAGVAYQLTMWHGTANLSMLVSDNFCTLILKPCLQDGPNYPAQALRF
jgi:hypothetical protein